MTETERIQLAGLQRQAEGILCSIQALMRGAGAAAEAPADPSTCPHPKEKRTTSSTFAEITERCGACGVVLGTKPTTED